MSNQNVIEPSQRWMLVITRLTFGGLFLSSGLQKALTGFSAASYLEHATSGPLAETFQNLAGQAWVDFLVVFGEIGLGLGLVLGLWLPLVAVAGTLMMMLFYLSSFPPEHNLISLHIIYSLVFVLLAVFRAGDYFGLNGSLMKRLLAK